ncbi:beta-galactosidase [Fusarium subglutinans]|uniref:Beta-galactosidase n=1 Tax=Gibberella subglutinans TaxID=42677 RepID=A0A8H5Q8A6_GIBSU|nr:beta-galactosidase [Fusarium subglutinans]KAF5609276.1 beta-galactosidase [Fusarium subglutinans]
MFWSSVIPFAGLCSLFLDFASAQTKYEVQKPPLDTDWTYEVGTNPWPEHPRPQLKRDAWKSLNGIWTWRGDGDLSNPPKEGPLDREVLVPACIESALSGLQILDQREFWYQRSFEVSDDWKNQTVLLHFEAVDYNSTVFVNGKEKTTHIGGYDRFTVDVTDDIKFGESNELLVFVNDPTDDQVIPIGKQTLRPSHIFYRSCSGIWQQVWLEAVPKDYITDLDLTAGADGQVTVTVHTSQEAGGSAKVVIEGSDGTELASHEGTADEEFTFTAKSPKLWWPDSPTLYNITVTLDGGDTVHSYTGFRTISKGKVENVTRPLLNGEFVFQFGTLDQGFWPDGLYTPPNREAMVSDLKLLKKFGFNMVRKHIKYEPHLFYQACDELGLLVIQDMPSLPADGNRKPNDAEQAEFQRQFEILVNQHKSYTSIVTWVIYNEGWGQRDGSPEKSLTELLQKLDKSRLINSISGWNDHGFGDFHVDNLKTSSNTSLTRFQDNHNYAEPQCGTPFYSQPKTPYDPERIGIAGEYGGIGHNVSIDHLWNVKQAIDSIPETYEINKDLDSYNYRSGVLFRDIREQTERFACSGAVYTQTSDVEGEVNGLITYDRRFVRPDVEKWQSEIASVYEAAASRGGPSNPDTEDEWQIISKEDTQPDDLVKDENKEVAQEKKSDNSEKSPAEEKRELAKAKWEGMQPQRGGVYPDREVKTPSYPQFTGNW